MTCRLYAGGLSRAVSYHRHQVVYEDVVLEEVATRPLVRERSVPHLHDEGMGHHLLPEVGVLVPKFLRE